MRSQTQTDRRRALPSHLSKKILSALLFTTLFAITLAGRDAFGQAAGAHPENIRQVSAPLPKLALTEAANDVKPGVLFRKVVLGITNWEKYPADMFKAQSGTRLPDNPCSQTSSRIVVSVYSARGDLLAGCIGVPTPSDLGKFGFRIYKGKPVPEFVYAVLNDRLTGAAYRSNLVSPSNGGTK
ncbi:MAG TPA: hypothetical protein VMZ26_01285 [Pyrinomonadaceae bacterium]|nr:hypothetical protein [Pyrinomonadaceae bacterium]